MFDNIKIMAKISLQPGHAAFCPCLCGRASAVVFKTDEDKTQNKANLSILTDGQRVWLRVARKQCQTNTQNISN